MQCTNHPEVDQDVVRCLRCQQPFCPDCVVLLRGYWYCGPCKDEVVRDLQSGTSGQADLATVGQRILALILDALIQGAATLLVAIPIFLLMGGLAAVGSGTQGPASEAASVLMGMGVLAFYGLMFAVSIGLPLVYDALFVARAGQTPGKRALGIRVVDVSGNPVTRGQAWGRAAVKTGLAQGCSCLGLLADDLPACFTIERTSLHDLASSTRVVRAL